MLTIGRARTVRFGNGKGLRLSTGGGSGPSNSLDYVVIGDSISSVNTGGGNVAGVPGAYMTEAQTYPAVLKALIEARQGVTVNLQRIAENGKSFNYNYLGGPTLNQMVMDPTTGITALIPTGRRAACKINIFAGTNGIALGANNGATEYAGLTTLIDWLISQGFTASNIAVVTCLPRNQAAPFETNRQDYNARIKADAGARGYKQVRVDESLGFNDANDNTEYLYQPDFPNGNNGLDQIHPGWVGHKNIAYFCYDGGHYAGGLFPAASFSPVLHLPNRLIFDPADYNAATGNWPSKVGSIVAIILVQATAGNRPTAGPVNGLPAVEYNGGASASTRQFLRALATGYGIGGVYLNAMTAFFADAYQSSSFIYNFGDAAAGWDTGPMLKNNGSSWNGRNNPDTTGPHVITAMHGTASGAIINSRAFIDDQWQQTVDNHPVVTTPANSFTDLTVGGANQFGVNFGGLDGRMGELIFWKPAEPLDYWVHRTQRYLKEKYATP